MHARSDNDDTPTFHLREKNGKNHKLNVGDFSEACYAETA